VTKRLTDALRGAALVFEARPQVRETPNREVPVLLLLLVCAAIVRFWGVGSYSLHKPDEATTALPAVHILQDGTPRFPGGMLYTRALAQSYLIAGSVAAFGQTEWSVRLPSVLCGVLLVFFAWRMGRRFLAAPWRLALAAIASFLPALIADSQEARMYIFLLATLAGFAILVFKWESSGRIGWLLAAVAAMMLGIQFQQLAIFGSLIVFFPGLVRGDLRLVRQAALAFLPIAAFFVYVRWTPSEYPLPISDFTASELQVGKAPSALGLRFHSGVTVLAVLAGAVQAWWLGKRISGGWLRAAVVLLVMGGMVALAGLYYHVGLLLLLAAVVLTGRSHGVSRWQLLALVMVVSALAAWQVTMLHIAGAGSLRKVFGVMVGQPSIWQFLIMATFSPLAALLLLAALVATLYRVTQLLPVDEVWLFFLLAVWLPLLLLGLTDWYFPPRYTEFALLPLMITVLAACQQWLPARGGLPLAAMAAVAIVNPLAAARAVNAGSNYPDHKGAAVLVRSLNPGSRDVIIAEDVLFQSYYLGRVDYWLDAPYDAVKYIERVDGKIVDQYTHAQLITTAAQLQAVIDRTDRGAIYIIGSGEMQEDGRRYIRGPELAPILESDRFTTIFIARDGLTRVWKIDPPKSGLP
jgi:4-amino-4-deoxy-L-arabinose transferase-like glycosyltransferase